MVFNSSHSPVVSHLWRCAVVAVVALPLAVATTFTLAPAHAAFPVSTASTEAGPPRLKVLTHNVFLMSQNLYPNWGQMDRADLIAEAGFTSGNDVIVYQEAFDNAASDHLLAKLADRYPHQTPVVGRSKTGWDHTSGNYSSWTPEDGGVTIVSKWPILGTEQHVFADACGADYFANKGFAYVALNVDGVKAHVVGTHLQSTDPGCKEGQAASIRRKQLAAIDAFLDAKDIPADEQVIVAGDLNVDSRSAEHADMLANGDLVDAYRDGWAYSFDTQDNSIGRYRYPGEPREDLDYVLYRRGNAQPDGWRNTTLKEASKEWAGGSDKFNDYSDHYPLVGQ